MTASRIDARHATINRAARILAGRGESSLVLWHGLAKSLGNIIGDAGFTSLFLRTLHQFEPRHPWLAAALAPDTRPIDYLATVLATRSRAEAEAVSTSMLLDFTDALSCLIGERVIQRILLGAWESLAADALPEESR